ncbi:MAG: EAL domain-containing protein, partial [Pseudomonadota bacterium]
MDNDKHRSAERIIYENFVDRLFEGRGQIIAGMCLQVAVMAILYVETFNPIFFVFPVLAVALALMRLRQSRQFHAERAAISASGNKPDEAWYRDWEWRFTLTTVTAALNVGLFSSSGYLLAETEFVAVVAIVLVFASVPSIIARLYGSIRLAAMMMVSLFLPLTLGVFTVWDAPHLVMVALFVPFTLSAMSMIRDVRQTFVFAVRGSLEKRLLGKRLNDAVSNMSHGLLMLDDDGQVIVLNDPAKAIFGLSEKRDFAGRSLAAVMRYIRRYGSYDAGRLTALSDILSRLAKGEQSKASVLISGKQTLELSANPRPGGGAVLLIEDITEQVRMSRKLEKMRTTDPITGLLNRDGFFTAISKALASSSARTQHSIIVFDIDDFKRVNDSAGHFQGDRLLKAVGQASRKVLGANAKITRHGADEFIACVRRSRKSLEAVCRELRDGLSTTYTVGGEQFAITISVGGADLLRDDHDGTDANIHASLALTDAKSRGSRSFSVYDPSMNVSQLRRQLLKGALMNAVHAGEISPLYQPIVDAKSGRLVACEALARWQHDELGVVSAEEFIPLAEEMGVVTRISRHMLSKAMQDSAKWPDDITVSVNLSAKDFEDTALTDWLLNALGRQNFNPSRLEIEITETSLIRNEAFVSKQLKR